jgi:mannose-6-phosphate isomerase-like protein (cupin superfamily)
MGSDSAVTHKPIDEMESILGGHFVRARGSLGLTAFGLAVRRFPADEQRDPPHAHIHDGQEEVYIPLSGSGWIEVADERVAIDTDTAVRVGPTATRRVLSGPDGLELLIAGRVPGTKYEPNPYMDAGAPEPDIAKIPGIAAAQGHESSNDFSVHRLSAESAITGVFDGVTFHPLRKLLGVSAFGISVIDLAPGDGSSEYPLHRHDEDGQTEVYVVSRGGGHVEVDGRRIETSAGDMVLIGPTPERQWFAGADGMRLITIGAPAGTAYEAPVPRN